MNRLLIPFAALSLFAVPALAAGPFTVGAQVLDPKGQPVGTIAAIEGDSVITVRTDKHDVRIPVTSFATEGGKHYLALDQAQLNAKFEADQAAITASLQPGKPVKGMGGSVLGTIDTIDDSTVVLTLASGQKVSLPRNGISGRVDGAVAGITAAQLEAQLKATQGSEPASTD